MTRRNAWKPGMAALLACTFTAVPASAQTADMTASDHPLAFMFGQWSGPAHGVGRDRQPFELTQTERVGPLPGGDLVLIEGRGYSDAGEPAFNAFAVVARNADDSAWQITSFFNGEASSFPFEARESGFVWSTPAGSHATMRYTARFEGDHWSQVGEYIAEGQPPVQTFGMELTRIGATDWPAADSVAVPPAED